MKHFLQAVPGTETIPVPNGLLAFVVPILFENDMIVTNKSFGFGYLQFPAFEKCQLPGVTGLQFDFVTTSRFNLRLQTGRTCTVV